jgi:hypothetical protein
VKSAIQREVEKIEITRDDKLDGTLRIRVHNKDHQGCLTLEGTFAEMTDFARSILQKLEEYGHVVGDIAPWTAEHVDKVLKRLRELVLTDMECNNLPEHRRTPVRFSLFVERADHLQHALFMLDQMPAMVQAGRYYKFNRWLGDVACTLRMLKIIELDDVKELFAPEGTTIDHARI